VEHHDEDLVSDEQVVVMDYDDDHLDLVNDDVVVNVNDHDQLEQLLQLGHDDHHNDLRNHRHRRDDRHKLVHDDHRNDHHSDEEDYVSDHDHHPIPFHTIPYHQGTKREIGINR
jgi:hypothetical protein